MGTLVLTVRGLTHIALHILGQFHRVLHILVLDKLEHDVALRRVRVVAVVGLLIVPLQIDDGILTLGHFEILHHAVLFSRAPASAQRIGLEAAHDTPLHRIDMDGDEQVGLRAVGYLCPAVEFHEAVGLPGIDDPYVRAVLLHEPPEGQGEFQCQVLLLHLPLADGTRVVAAVTSIDDQRELLARSTGRHRKAYHCYQKQYNLLTHIILIIR